MSTLTSCRGFSARRRVKGGDHVGRRWTVVGGDGPVGEAQPPVGADDEVAAELAGVACRPSEFLAGAHELYVLLDGRGPVDLAQRASPEAVRAVRFAVFVAEHRERNVEMSSVAAEQIGAAEGDDRDLDVVMASVSFEFVAHGDDVLLARQSHQMAVEDQHHATTLVIRETPLVTVVVGQGEVGCEIASFHEHQCLLDHGGIAGAYLATRWAQS